MRTIQEIFDAVIEGGFYGVHSDMFMCNALDHAHQEALITLNERDLADQEICGYMDLLKKRGTSNSCTLMRHLTVVGLPCSFEACLLVYKDWENRPLPN